MLKAVISSNRVLQDDHEVESISSFWINNIEAVHQNIRRLKSSSKAKNVYSYDLTILYTSIPHDKLMAEMESVIDAAF